jgi:formylglycine-generating enzyme required for sulfatase activity
VSPFGAMDMGGNVSEMTATLVDRRPVRGKLGSEHSFVYRGGNFVDGEEAARNSYRWTIRAVGESIPSVGFRCVLSKKDWKRK